MRNNRPGKSSRFNGSDKSPRSDDSKTLGNDGRERPKRLTGADKRAARVEKTDAERRSKSARAAKRNDARPKHASEVALVDQPRTLERNKPRPNVAQKTNAVANPNEMRLNKFLAESGLASRRGADDLITEGKVTVNGKRVYELGIKVNLREDKVLVDGKPVRPDTRKLYILFNKPKGVMTTMEDPEGRPCIAEYFTNLEQRVYPVGRLDYDSEGLLLMTNDGEFAQRVTHPKHEVFKTYLVKVNGQPTDEHIRKLRTGVTIIGGRVAAREVEKLRGTASDKYDWLKVVIGEGKNRQIRRMFEKIGFDVMKLQRIAIGRLKMGGLARGEWAMLTSEEVEKIFANDADSFEGRNRPQPRSDGTVQPRKKSFKQSNRPKSAKALARDESSRRGLSAKPKTKRTSVAARRPAR